MDSNHSANTGWPYKLRLFWGGGEGRGEESDHSHHYSSPAFQNKYEGWGGGGK